VEWDRASPDSPSHAAKYGSPTVLVDGRDVTGVEAVDGANACRVYDHGGRGLGGVPPVQRIVDALSGGESKGPVRNARPARHEAADNCPECNAS
jgi:hypothetical protein